jgi:hypothetical protein
MGEWMYRSTFSWPRQKLEVSGQLHAPAALPPGKSPRYQFYRRLGGPQSRSGRYGEVKIFLPYRDSNSAPLLVAVVIIININTQNREYENIRFIYT